MGFIMTTVQSPLEFEIKVRDGLSALLDLSKGYYAQSEFEVTFQEGAGRQDLAKFKISIASADKIKGVLEDLKQMNGVYILQNETGEDPENSEICDPANAFKCYVGKSTDLSARLGTHSSNNKIGFTRIFVLSNECLDRGDMTSGWVADLSYIESKVYLDLQTLGISLANKQKFNNLNKRYSKTNVHYPIDLAILKFLQCCVLLGFNQIGAAESISSTVKGGSSNPPAPPNPPPNSHPVPPKAKELWTMVFKGSKFSNPTKTSVYLEAILRIVEHQKDPSYFLDLVDNTMSTGTSRSIISKNKAMLYPNKANDPSWDSKIVSLKGYPAYFIGKNNSGEVMLSNLKKLCALANPPLSMEINPSQPSSADLVISW